MKKKIIIAGAILVVLAGGIGVGYTVVSYKTTHPANSNEYYVEEPSSGEPSATGTEIEKDTLPSRDKVVTTPDSIYCLVNKEYSLPSDYEPDDLVEPNVTFSINYESEKKLLRKEASVALESLFSDAAKEELELVAVSGYRSYERQQEIYENNLKTRGTTHTNQYSAKPGYSEHQTGLVMDVSCKSENYDLQESFGETPEGIWLAQNAHTYGYIIRYPEDKCEITGYAYEPWHIRYVGVELATYLYENKMTLDEYFHYKPSYDFITDDSEYLNDEKSDEQNSYTIPSTSTPPSSVSTNTDTKRPVSSNTGETSSQSSVTVSSAPASPKPSEAPSTAPEATPAPEATKPAASVKPSKVPSAKPSTPATVAPTTVAPSPSPSSNPDNSTTEPGSPDHGDDGSDDATVDTVD